MWRSFNPLNKAECVDCKMLFLCAGACAHKHLISGQNPCLSMKYNLKSRLLMYALTVGMISADEILVTGTSKLCRFANQIDNIHVGEKDASLRQKLCKAMYEEYVKTCLM